MHKLILTLLLLLPALATAKDVVTQGAGGGINWTQGYVWAEGYGVARDSVADHKKRLLARRAATVDAYRNLAEFMDGVRVSSETVVKDMKLESGSVRTRIEALVKGALLVKDHYQNDVAQVTMRIYFDGDFSSAINRQAMQRSKPSSYRFFDDALSELAAYGEVIRRFGMAPAFAASADGRLIQSGSDLEMANRLLQQAEHTDPQQLIRRLQTDADSYRESTAYTGLLVDARSVSNFELATIPRIRDPEGNIIYPMEELFNTTLAAKRPVSYDFNMEDAIRNDRIAATPFIIKAQSTFKSRRSDLVISAEAARFLSSNSSIMEVVNNAGVLIVVAE